MDEEDLILPHNQRDYLYIDGWDGEDDHLLLDYMLSQKQRAEAARESIDFTGEFAFEAHEELAEEFNHDHDAHAVLERIEFLRKRIVVRGQSHNKCKFKGLYKYQGVVLYSNSLSFNMHAFTDISMLHKVPIQSQYLYNGNWSPEVDGVLIETMMRLKEEVGWVGEDFPPNLMPIVARELHDKCGLWFTEVSIVIRISFLASRRRTFHEIITTKGTYWKRSENFVYAVDTVWVAMMKVQLKT